MPNAFIDMFFKKHVSEIVNECARDNYCKMFFYLPSTTNRKKGINQYMDNVSLSTINCKYESFKAFLPTNDHFIYNHLDLKGSKKRDQASKIMYIFLKKCS